ncbi:hypothetical protein FNF28_05364 [Cafeteria roenbergensis]|uniref:Uncharacterized protein n=1 Tax=Cafeteria roenbergensis TaxID=33653 RepID=A0A5A8D6E1_CAFRO|nr:hypothetical protein FNF28_05364 [Cafeteria roenbergensis]
MGNEASAVAAAVTDVSRGLEKARGGDWLEGVEKFNEAVPLWMQGQEGRLRLAFDVAKPAILDTVLKLLEKSVERVTLVAREYDYPTREVRALLGLLQRLLAAKSVYKAVAKSDLSPLLLALTAAVRTEDTHTAVLACDVAHMVALRAGFPELKATSKEANQARREEAAKQAFIDAGALQSCLALLPFCHAMTPPATADALCRLLLALTFARQETAPPGAIEAAVEELPRHQGLLWEWSRSSQSPRLRVSALGLLRGLILSGTPAAAAEAQRGAMAWGGLLWHLRLAASPAKQDGPFSRLAGPVAAAARERARRIREAVALRAASLRSEGDMDAEAASAEEEAAAAEEDGLVADPSVLGPETLAAAEALCTHAAAREASREMVALLCTRNRDAQLVLERAMPRQMLRLLTEEAPADLPAEGGEAGPGAPAAGESRGGGEAAGAGAGSAAAPATAGEAAVGEQELDAAVDSEELVGTGEPGLLWWDASQKPPVKDRAAAARVASSVLSLWYGEAMAPVPAWARAGAAASPRKGRALSAAAQAGAEAATPADEVRSGRTVSACHAVRGPDGWNWARLWRGLLRPWQHPAMVWRASSLEELRAGLWAAEAALDRSRRLLKMSSRAALAAARTGGVAAAVAGAGTLLDERRTAAGRAWYGAEARADDDPSIPDVILPLPMLPWEHRAFRIRFPSLDRLLSAGGVFLHALLPLIPRIARGEVALPLPKSLPMVLARAVGLEANPRRRLALLRALRGLAQAVIVDPDPDADTDPTSVARVGGVLTHNVDHADARRSAAGAEAPAGASAAASDAAGAAGAAVADGSGGSSPQPVAPRTEPGTSSLGTRATRLRLQQAAREARAARATAGAQACGLTKHDLALPEAIAMAAAVIQAANCGIRDTPVAAAVPGEDAATHRKRGPNGAPPHALAVGLGGLAPPAQHGSDSGADRFDKLGAVRSAGAGRGYQAMERTDSGAGDPDPEMDEAGWSPQAGAAGAGGTAKKRPPGDGGYGADGTALRPASSASGPFFSAVEDPWSVSGVPLRWQRLWRAEAVLLLRTLGSEPAGAAAFEAADGAVITALLPLLVPPPQCKREPLKPHGDEAVAGIGRGVGRGGGVGSERGALSAASGAGGAEADVDDDAVVEGLAAARTRRTGGLGAAQLAAAGPAGPYPQGSEEAEDSAGATNESDEDVGDDDPLLWYGADAFTVPSADPAAALRLLSPAASGAGGAAPAPRAAPDARRRQSAWSLSLVADDPDRRLKVAQGAAARAVVGRAAAEGLTAALRAAPWLAVSFARQDRVSALTMPLLLASRHPRLVSAVVDCMHEVLPRITLYHPALPLHGVFRALLLTADTAATDRMRGRAERGRDARSRAALGKRGRRLDTKAAAEREADAGAAQDAKTAAGKEYPVRVGEGLSVEAAELLEAMHMAAADARRFGRRDAASGPASVKAGAMTQRSTAAEAQRRADDRAVAVAAQAAGARVGGAGVGGFALMPGRAVGGRDVGGRVGMSPGSGAGGFVSGAAGGGAGTAIPGAIPGAIPEPLSLEPASADPAALAASDSATSPGTRASPSARRSVSAMVDRAGVARSSLTGLLPPSMIALLMRRGARAFAAVFNADDHASADALWTASMRNTLLRQLRRQMAPLLDDEPRVADVYLRVYVGGAALPGDPKAFVEALSGALHHEAAALAAAHLMLTEGTLSAAAAAAGVALGGAATLARTESGGARDDGDDGALASGSLGGGRLAARVVVDETLLLPGSGAAAAGAVSGPGGAEERGAAGSTDGTKRRPGSGGGWQGGEAAGASGAAGGPGDGQLKLSPGMRRGVAAALRRWEAEQEEAMIGLSRLEAGEDPGRVFLERADLSSDEDEDDHDDDAASGTAGPDADRKEREDRTVRRVRRIFTPTQLYRRHHLRCLVTLRALQRFLSQSPGTRLPTDVFSALAVVLSLPQGRYPVVAAQGVALQGGLQVSLDGGVATRADAIARPDDDDEDEDDDGDESASAATGTAAAASAAAASRGAVTKAGSGSGRRGRGEPASESIRLSMEATYVIENLPPTPAPLLLLLPPAEAHDADDDPLRDSLFGVTRDDGRRLRGFRLALRVIHTASLTDEGAGLFVRRPQLLPAVVRSARVPWDAFEGRSNGALAAASRQGRAAAGGAAEAEAKAEDGEDEADEEGELVEGTLLLAGGIGGPGQWSADVYMAAHASMRLARPALACVASLAEVLGCRRPMLDSGALVFLLQAVLGGPNDAGAFPAPGKELEGDDGQSLSRWRRGRAAAKAESRRRRQQRRQRHGGRHGGGGASAAAAASGAGGGDGDWHSSVSDDEEHGAAAAGGGRGGSQYGVPGHRLAGSADGDEEDGWSEQSIRAAAELALFKLVQTVSPEARAAAIAASAAPAPRLSRMTSAVEADLDAGEEAEEKDREALEDQEPERPPSLRLEDRLAEARAIQERVEARLGAAAFASRLKAGLQAAGSRSGAPASQLRLVGEAEDDKATQMLTSVLRTMLTPGLANLLLRGSSGEGPLATPDGSLCRVALRGRATERPQVVWGEWMREQLLRRLSHEAAFVDARSGVPASPFATGPAGVGLGAAPAHSALPGAPRRGPHLVLWTADRYTDSDGYRELFPSLCAELVIEGVYVRLYFKQPDLSKARPQPEVLAKAIMAELAALHSQHRVFDPVPIKPLASLVTMLRAGGSLLARMPRLRWVAAETGHAGALAAMLRRDLTAHARTIRQGLNPDVDVGGMDAVMWAQAIHAALAMMAQLANTPVGAAAVASELHALHSLLRREELQQDNGVWVEMEMAASDGALPEGSVPGRGGIASAKAVPGSRDPSDAKLALRTGAGAAERGAGGGGADAGEAEEDDDEDDGGSLDPLLKRTTAVMALRTLGAMLRNDVASRAAFLEQGVALSVLSVVAQSLQPQADVKRLHAVRALVAGMGGAPPPPAATAAPAPAAGAGGGAGGGAPGASGEEEDDDEPTAGSASAKEAGGDGLTMAGAEDAAADTSASADGGRFGVGHAEERTSKWLCSVVWPLFDNDLRRRQVLVRGWTKPQGVLGAWQLTLREPHIVWGDATRDDVTSFVIEEWSAMDDWLRSRPEDPMPYRLDTLHERLRRPALSAECIVGDVFVHPFNAKPSLRGMDAEALLKALFERARLDLSVANNPGSSPEAIRNVAGVWRAVRSVAESKSSLANAALCGPEARLALSFVGPGVPFRVQRAVLEVLEVWAEDAGLAAAVDAAGVYVATRLVSACASARKAMAAGAASAPPAHAGHHAASAAGSAAAEEAEEDEEEPGGPLGLCGAEPADVLVFNVMASLARRAPGTAAKLLGAGAVLYAMHAITKAAASGSGSSSGSGSAALAACRLLSVLAACSASGSAVREVVCDLVTTEVSSATVLEGRPEAALRFFSRDHTDEASGRQWNGDARAALLTFLAEELSAFEAAVTSSGVDSWDQSAPRWDPRRIRRLHAEAVDVSVVREGAGGAVA